MELWDGVPIPASRILGPRPPANTPFQHSPGHSCCGSVVAACDDVGKGRPHSPPDQNDHRGKRRNLPLGKSHWAICGTQSFRSQPPPSPPPPPRPPLLIPPRPRGGGGCPGVPGTPQLPACGALGLWSGQVRLHSSLCPRLCQAPVTWRCGSSVSEACFAAASLCRCRTWAFPSTCCPQRWTQARTPPPGMHYKGGDLRGGLVGGWRRLPKRLGAVTVGYKCH